jgi:hypothetical protein
MSDPTWPPHHETVVAWPAAVQALVWAGFPLLGAAAGWLLTLGAGWLSTVPFGPVRWLFSWVATIPEPVATIGAAAVGGLLGLAVAVQAQREALAVTVTDHGATLRRDGAAHEVPRAAVRAVFVDATHLVLLDGQARELAREPSDLDIDRLAAAFRAHGYPWRDGDPHRDAYRRWVPGTPGLPAGADALLKARQRALDRAAGEEVAQLRDDLARLGVVVRDEAKRQYWRQISGGAQGGT